MLNETRNIMAKDFKKMVLDMREAQKVFRKNTRNEILRKRMRSEEAGVDAFLKRHLRETEKGTFKGKVKDMRDMQRLFFSSKRTDMVKKLLGMAERDVDIELERHFAKLEQLKLF